jgi:negative regulator of replication initiation
VPSCHRRHRRRRTSAAAAAEKNDTTTTTIAQHGRAFQHLFLSSEFSQRNESFALTRIFKTKQKQNKNDLAKERRNAYYRTTRVLY